MTQEPEKKTPERVLAAICAQPWCITRQELQGIIAIASRHGDVEAVLSKRGERPANARRLEVFGSVGVLHIQGPLIRYADVFSEISGATSVEGLARDFRAAMDDPAIKAIVLNVDSPGGQANGINELAAMIFQARAKKTIKTYVSSRGASGGYWLAAAGSEIVIDPTAMLGSIGVVFGFVKNGKEVIEIVSDASPRKRPDLDSEEGRAQIRETANAIAKVFIESVAAMRGVPAAKVEKDFGQGGVLVGEYAVNAGLADRLGSLEEVIASLQHNHQTQQRGMTMSEQGKPEAITAEAIAKDHPQIADHFRKQGAAAELARVKGVLELSAVPIKGPVVDMALDGETGREQAAFKLLQADNEKRRIAAEAMGKDAGKIPAVDTTRGEESDAEASRKAAVSNMLAGANNR